MISPGDLSPPPPDRRCPTSTVTATSSTPYSPRPRPRCLRRDRRGGYRPRVWDVAETSGSGITAMVCWQGHDLGSTAFVSASWRALRQNIDHDGSGPYDADAIASHRIVRPARHRWPDRHAVLQDGPVVGDRVERPTCSPNAGWSDSARPSWRCASDGCSVS